tara:strand:+ start:3317 stop:3622 length:306 start_codon:yes stop_codon:yes gene_type:complete
MQEILNKTESLRNKKRILNMRRSADTIKRAVCGRVVEHGQEFLIISMVQPLKEDIVWILDVDMCTGEELIDTLGDKINSLKKDGFEIDYRFDKPIISKEDE